MASIKLPQADDSELMPVIGHNFLRAHGSYGGDASYEHQKDFRILDWQDIGAELIDTEGVAEGFGEVGFVNQKTKERSQSVASRLTELYQAHKDGPKMSIQDANDQYGIEGRLKFDREMTESEAKILRERKIREMKFQLIYNQAKGW